MNEFPRWKFSPAVPDGLIVASPEEEDALGEGWFNSPAEFPAEEKKKKGSK